MFQMLQRDRHGECEDINSVPVALSPAGLLGDCLYLWVTCCRRGAAPASAAVYRSATATYGVTGAGGGQTSESAENVKQKTNTAYNYHVESYI